MEKILYAELTPQEFRDRLNARPVAYLPVGTLEWHGEHLPFGTDALIGHGLLSDIARKAGGIVLPMVFMGPDGPVGEAGGVPLYGMDGWTGEQDWGKKIREPGRLEGSAYWQPDDHFMLQINDIFAQLARAGFKAVVVEGHGPSVGNIIKHGDELEKKHGLKIFNCWGYSQDGKWVSIAKEIAEATGITGGHGGSGETAGIMAFRPELVRLDRLEGRWPAAGVGGTQHPNFATPEKGRVMMDMTRDFVAEQVIRYFTKS